MSKSRTTFVFFPTMISLMRIPLAFLFLWGGPFFRITAVLIALITDVLDGWIARRFNWQTQMGAIVDPLTDKFFFLCILIVFLKEKRLNAWEAAALLSRDFSVILFGAYLFFKQKLHKYTFRSIFTGKIMTSLQFLVAIALLLSYPISEWIFLGILILGMGAFLELYLCKRSNNRF